MYFSKFLGSKEVESTETVANSLGDIEIPKGFKDKHIKILNENGTLTISGERVTKGKLTGITRYRSFAVSVSDPQLEGANVFVKDGKIQIEHKKEE